ncbi:MULTISPECIES: hypothetical protein [unclassified Ruegeria]|uniref:hypothetical protein n=1 Tax=unclassified Ruegeria TaxID=2625375 RepID=UPI001490F0B7|nr:MULTISPECIES: hypothetical protein [unclassified Ruegeria]NOC47088.1 hypothetical protein [Ruegeria sp. HKCCD7559]NOD86088.1 hypothetical protein [Ruegeria sp. HKCCD6119]
MAAGIKLAKPKTGLGHLFRQISELCEVLSLVPGAASVDLGSNQILAQIHNIRDYPINPGGLKAFHHVFQLRHRWKE